MAFLKRATFEMLCDKCSDHPVSGRLVPYLIDLIEYA